MRQEVRALVTLIFDADVSLSKEQLKDAIENHLKEALIWAEIMGRPVVAIDLTVEAVREEAEIYGNEA